MELSIQSYISIFSVVISITALILAYLKFSNDNPKIEFSCEIGEKSVRITLFNTGRRPVFIKSVGVFEWPKGTHFFGANKSVDKLLNEAESFTVEEPYTLVTIWKIKHFVAVDHNNRIWISSMKQMRNLYEIAHFKPIEGTDYFTSGGNPKKAVKASKKREKNKEKSIKQYRKFAKKNLFDSRLK
ncbi:hypothetical protein ACWU4D_17675 [Vibrio sp. WJH972]